MPTPESAAAPTPEPEAAGVDALRASATSLASTLLANNQRPVVLATLAKFEVGKVKELPAGRVQEFIDALNAAAEADTASA